SSTGTAVNAYYQYDAPSKTVTFIPRSVLANLTRYTITIKVKDSSGALSSPYAWSFTTVSSDVTPPSTPGTPVAGVPTITSVALTWAASTDNVGVVAYQVSGGPTVVTSTTPSVTLTGLTPSTSYTVTVKALDAAGNVSPASGAALFTNTAVPLPGATSGTGIPGATGRTLVLYDSTGPYAFLGEQYALATANLSSHFCDWT